jgi:cold shock CspA family protein
MKLPPQVTFKGMDASAAIETRIQQSARKLDRFNDCIMSCRVVVEAPHRHHHKGNVYHVIVEVMVPGGELVVNRNGERNHSHEDVHVAIRDAFAAMAHKLEGYARRQRGAVKSHDAPRQGRIARLYAHEGYGFIESADGVDVYFNENALHGVDIGTLAVGAPVRFEMTDIENNDGPEATTVLRIGKQQLIVATAR